MKYMILIYSSEQAWAAMSEEEGRKAFAEYMDYTAELSKAGVVLGGSSLQPTFAATTLRTKDGKLTTTDGPFAETKEQLGGYYLIDVPDLDAAIKWGSKCPAVRYGSVEIRPLGPDETSV